MTMVFVAIFLAAVIAAALIIISMPKGGKGNV